MVTKYNTGDSVLIPATIRNAEERDGQIFYNVDADIWEGFPENAIVSNEKAAVQKAMISFERNLTQAQRW
jgi:hypothetical protein